MPLGGGGWGGAGRGGAGPGEKGGRGGGRAPVLLGGNGWGWQGGRPESTTMLSRRRRRLPEATARPVRCHEFDWVDTDL